MSDRRCSGMVDRNKIDWRERIHADPAVLAGKPVVRGTRLAVDFLLELLAVGWSEDEILANYPQLRSEDLRAVLGYASEHVREDTVHVLAPA